MKYLNGYNNYYIARDLYNDSELVKEEVDTSIFEKNFYHNHKDVFFTFCSLTHKTYPHGTEADVLKYIKHPLKVDNHGNYFIKIGESKTMFSSHLDSAAHATVDVKLLTYEKDKHKFIGTDGTSILGADDKAGVTVMLYMIENNIPGLYYFFIGEERGGIGSHDLSLEMDNENLKNIKRCIAFDRYGYNSVITHQMMDRCCSDIFADALCKEFNKHGLNLRKDDTGIFTDSANFVNRIQECTNISVGYFHEHTKREFQNITYLEQFCEAVLNIDWEKLPSHK
jgi:putative aminopeptidase FrvX